jgi:hypothetical protein
MNPPLDAAEGCNGSLIIRAAFARAHAFPRTRMHLSVRLGKPGGVAAVRGLVVFVLALAAAYGVAFIVDWAGRSV